MPSYLTLDKHQKELAKLRTGRANPALLDGIKVDYYGAPTPLNGVANINVPEARLIVIKPWDRSTLSLIEKALHDAYDDESNATLYRAFYQERWEGHHRVTEQQPLHSGAPFARRFTATSTDGLA